MVGLSVGLANDGLHHRASAETYDRQPQRMGGVVQAAALSLLWALGHVDGTSVCVDSEHLDQAAMAGTISKVHMEF